MELRRLSFHALLVAVLLRRASSFAVPPSRFAAPRHSASALRAGAAANEGSIEVPRADGSTHALAYRVVRPMSLSSRQAAPIVALHGGPSVPSNYLFPLEDIVPYRSIVFYDQVGCGKSDEPNDIEVYSIEDSVKDLQTLLKQLGVRRFHLYGQSYGGILAFEYMKSLVSTESQDEVECLSAILSGSPTNIREVEEDFGKLLQELSPPDNATDEEMNELFRVNYQCRLPEMPRILHDAYANAGTVWRGTDAIREYVAKPPPEDAKRMPSALIMRGEYDFVSEAQVEGWKSAFNTPFLRYKTLENCSHHAMLENGAVYGDIVDSYFAEYD